jgi:hypothetical protein
MKRLVRTWGTRTESVDLLLRGDDVGREQAAEAEAVPLGHRERRALQHSSSQQASEVQNPQERELDREHHRPPARPRAPGRNRTEAYPVEPGVVEDVGAALVEDDGAVALRRHVLPRVLGEEEQAAQAVRGEGSPEIPRDGRHPRAVS